MNRLAEIFVKFMNIMHENNRDFKKARIELLNEGYSLQEIESTLEWYFGEMHKNGRAVEQADAFIPPSPKSFRFFTLEEQRRLSAEARAYITEMLYVNAISLEEVEEILEVLAEYLIDDASVEEVHSIMIGFRSVEISSRDGSEDNLDFKIRYLQ